MEPNRNDSQNNKPGQNGPQKPKGRLGFTILVTVAIFLVFS